MDDQCSSTDEIAPPRESGGCVVDEDGDEENEVRDGPRKRGGSEGAGTGGAEEERYKEVHYKEVQRELHEAEKKERERSDIGGAGNTGVGSSTSCQYGGSGIPAAPPCRRADLPLSSRPPCLLGESSGLQVAQCSSNPPRPGGGSTTSSNMLALPVRHACQTWSEVSVARRLHARAT